MNTQEIKINVPDGKIAVYDEATQTIKFVDVEPVRSKSWEEFCQNHKNTLKEFYISPDSLLRYVQLGPDNRLVEKDRNLLETQEDAEGILALIQLIRLHDEWVEDWKPKYDYYGISYNIDEETFQVRILLRDTRILMFPTREMAREFLDCFKDLIEKAKRFI